MEREPGMAFELIADILALVGSIVVHDQMERNRPGKLLVQKAQKLEKLLVAVALTALADHLALERLPRGEQSRGAVAFVAVGHRSAAVLLERQARLGPVQGLEMLLIVDLLTPWALAIVRQLQCVAPSGLVCRVVSAMAAKLLLVKAPPPQDHRLPVHRPLAGDGQVGLSLGGGQHGTAAQGDLLRGAVGGHPLLRLLTFGCGECAAS